MFKLRPNPALILAFCLVQNLWAQSPTHRLSAPITDYAVDAIHYSNGYALLHGSFNDAGSYSGSVVAIDAVNGIANPGWPIVSGDVNAIIPDGAGGYYAGGAFGSVNNEDVGNLIHILPNKTLDRNWLPNPSGSVYSLILKDNILYVGGTFVSISGQSRYYAAAFDIASGSLTNWNPHPNNRITEIVVTDNAVFLAGIFSEMNDGTALRNRIAAVDKANGTVLAGWNLALEGNSFTVNTMVASATTLYVGGSFNTVNGVTRNGLAAVSLSDATLDATWNPSPLSSATPVVHTLDLSGTTLYVGGSFNAGLGGDNSIKHLGAVSTSGTGNAINTFKPVFDLFDQILEIRLAGSSLYVYGYFNSISGSERILVGSINISNGIPNAWAPEIQGGVQSIMISGSTVFLAGDLVGLNWDSYNGLAVMDESTGTFWPHSIETGGGEDIYDMIVNGNTMYVGGRFTSINGVSRKNLAAIDLSSGAVLPWNPEAMGTSNTSFDDTKVTALEFNNNTVYVAGVFLSAGGQTRRGLAAIDASTGAATAWNPGVGDGTSMDEYVVSMDINDNSLFVAGTFFNLAGQSRPFLGAVDLTSGSLVDWHPEVINEVRKIRVKGNAAYVSGDFSDGIAGVSRPYGIAALDISTAEATSFNPEFNSTAIGDFALTDTDIYVGGYYSTAANETRPGLSSFSLTTGLLNSWTPDVGSAGEGNYDIQTLAVSDSRLYVGGGFVYVGNENRTGYAEYDLSVCSTTADITLNGSTLQASGGSAYQWYENDIAVNGATSEFYPINVFEYGRYAVEVTSNGCTARSADYIYLVTDRESEAEMNVHLYPNPISDDLFIEVPFESTLTVFDLAGKTIATSTLSFQEKNHITTNDWHKGAYILKVQNHKSSQTFKIIKTN